MSFSRFRRSYPSDLTDDQWECIRDLIPIARRGGRPRTTDVRQIVNAIFFINRTGSAWRYLPKHFAPWQTVYDYFTQWKRNGVWKSIHDHIRNQLRLREGKQSAPSTLIIDSQSIKAQAGSERGYDGYKRIRGRKRHILVDTLGFVHSLHVHQANSADTYTGHLLFEKPRFSIDRLERIYADHGYRGTFVAHTQKRFGFSPSIPPVRKDSGMGKRKKYMEKLKAKKLRGLPPKRWIVERTFAWFNHYRRLSKDYERKASHSESMIWVAMTQLMLRRLAPDI